MLLSGNVLASPGAMHDTGCSGLAHWDDPEAGGFRMGNTCTPVADAFRYMAEPIKYCKVLKKKKENKEKKKIKIEKVKK